MIYYVYPFLVLVGILVTFIFYHYIQDKPKYLYILLGAIGVIFLRLTELNPFFHPKFYELNWLLMLIPYIGLVLFYEQYLPFKNLIDDIMKSKDKTIN